MAKTWFITGASRGLGVEFAKAALRAGDNVVATGRNVNDVRTNIGADSAQLLTLAQDVTDIAQTQQAVAAAIERFGAIDALINNAGYGHLGFFEEAAPEDIQAQYATNVFGLFNVTRAVLPLMQERKYGRIVNVASVTGPLVTNPKAAGYSSAKAAMTGLTRVTAIENASRNITCNAVLPGWIETASSSKEEILAGKAAPSKRPGTAAEVAAACLFLASEEASYVNGAMLVVDGANSIVEFKGAGDDWY